MGPLKLQPGRYEELTLEKRKYAVHYIMPEGTKTTAGERLLLELEGKWYRVIPIAAPATEEDVRFLRAAQGLTREQMEVLGIWEKVYALLEFLSEVKPSYGSTL